LLPTIPQTEADSLSAEASPPRRIQHWMAGTGRKLVLSPSNSRVWSGNLPVPMPNLQVLVENEQICSWNVKVPTAKTRVRGRNPHVPSENVNIRASYTWIPKARLMIRAMNLGVPTVLPHIWCFGVCCGNSTESVAERIKRIEPAVST